MVPEGGCEIVESGHPACILLSLLQAHKLLSSDQVYLFFRKRGLPQYVRQHLDQVGKVFAETAEAEAGCVAVAAG
jgi:hypothetical protein